MTGYTTNLHPTLYTKLQALEGLLGTSLYVTSGYRTPEHNKDVGGVEGSEHTYDPSEAADISCPTSGDRFKLLKYAIQLGFVRIGVGKTFIHLGIATDKPQEVVWLY